MKHTQIETGLGLLQLSVTINLHLAIISLMSPFIEFCANVLLLLNQCLMKKFMLLYFDVSFILLIDSKSIMHTDVALLYHYRLSVSQLIVSLFFLLSAIASIFAPLELRIYD